METLPSHFDGKRFRNPVPRRNGLGGLLRWQLSRRRGEWRAEQELAVRPLPLTSSEELRITFINHSTFLLQIAGINILTDPIWAKRASPLSWAGPRRYTPPGVAFEDLPPIDLVLISHDHYDHLDLPTLRRLEANHRPTIYVGINNVKLLERNGIFGAVELDWWQEATARTDLLITAVPAQHFSGRSLFDRDRRLWCGFILQAGNRTVYFAGDTGGGPHFAQIAKKFPEIDLAILPIGAYRPRWFMGEVHLAPEQALEAHLLLGARVSVASHFGTFQLADDGQSEPVVELREVLRSTELHTTEFWVMSPGEGRNVPDPRDLSLETPAAELKSTG
jgi:L-ascorbate metabolism protein UlaG (beta-lactamase superfamily)